MAGKRLEDTIPLSLDHWIIRSTASEIVSSILATEDEKKINDVLAFFGRSNIKLGSSSEPGEQIGDLVIGP